VKISENAEDYLACIYDLSSGGAPVKTTEISSRLGLSPASVTEMTQRLASEGYLEYERYRGVRLTPSGQKVAERIKRRHRLLERFLVDVLGLPREHSHEEAMKLEHTFSDESVERLSKMMNNPTVCPDGDPIPAPEAPFEDDESSVALTELDEGDEGSITHLICLDSGKIRRLIGMGFVPGRTVLLEEKVPLGGPLLVKLGDMRVAISRDYASLVQVQR